MTGDFTEKSSVTRNTCKCLFFLKIRKCQRCKRYRSVRTGSFFEASRLSLQQHLQFLWKWSQEDSLRVIYLEGIALRKTLVKLARKCREVAWGALILHPIPMLGGPGVIVQIDESKFNHKSKVCRALLRQSIISC